MPVKALGSASQVYNCSDTESEAIIETELDITKAYETNMLEEALRELCFSGCRLALKLPARKIKTYRIVL